MFDRDDPVHLLGQDPESVVARLADASVRGDMFQLAETRLLFVLVSRRAAATLPPTSGRFTAALILGPVAALARTVDDIDDALAAVFGWLLGKPTFVLQALGRRLDQVERMVEACDGPIDEALAADLHLRTRQASVDVRVGYTPCRIVACGNELQVRFRDPDTGRYLTLAHLPFDPDWNAPAREPTPELTA